MTKPKKTKPKKSKYWVIVWTGEDADICDEGVFKYVRPAQKELEWWSGAGHDGRYVMVDMMLTEEEAEALNNTPWKSR